jgi:DNA-binding transcriptional ArsR family regulator
MPESLDAYAELRAMRARLEGIEHRQEMLVRAHRKEILAEIWRYIDADPLIGEVYLVVDGKRTQQAIVEVLNRNGVKVSQPTVSRRLAKLMNELGLVEIVERDVSGIALRKSDLDKILHLSPKVERRLLELRKAKTQASGSRRTATT